VNDSQDGENDYQNSGRMMLFGRDKSVPKLAGQNGFARGDDEATGRNGRNGQEITGVWKTCQYECGFLLLLLFPSIFCGWR
jgi:hypothetical protein